MPKEKKIKKARDAGTGRWVTKEYAEKHPKTTVVETVKTGKNKKSGRK